MFDIFIFSLNSTLPVFFIIIIGMILRRIGILSESYASATDKLVFKAALPALMFKDISEMDFRQDFDMKFVLFCVVTTIVMFLGLWLISAMTIKDKQLIGSFVQGSARGSAAILGIALATNIYGSSGLAPLMVFSSVPLFNILSVIILALNSNEAKTTFSYTSILKCIIKNPVILGVLFGIPFSVFNIELPAVFARTISSFSSITTPMALLAIGASFSFKNAKEKTAPAVCASFIKLFLLPLIFLPIAIFMGFRHSALVAIFVMLGSPTTVTCYIMSKNMGNDHVLSSNIIMLSTLFSCVSVTFWVFILKYFAFI